MINHAHSRIQLSRQYDTGAGVVITDEGQALVYVNDAGFGKVKLSAGSGTEYFAGLTLNYVMLPLAIPYVSPTAGVVPVSNTITLPFTPISGQFYLYDVTTSTVQTAGNPGTTANKYSITGNVVTVNSAQGADHMYYQLSYAPTVAQALAQFGEGFPGAQASQQVQGRIGAITKGTVSTSMYDASCAWTAGAPVQLGANGILTQTGSGSTLANVIVAAVPANESGSFLVVDLL